jgi:putative tryptophan/tyrosine transport system substrate-binding protein
MLTERRRLVDLAARNRLPAVYSWRRLSLPEASCPMDRTARISIDVPRPFVDRILMGIKPSEQPTKFELIINLKAAKALA